MPALQRVSALQAWLTARRQLMALNVKPGMQAGTEQFKALSEQTVVRFTQQMGGLKYLNELAAVGLLDIISTTPLDAEHRAACVEVVNAKVAGPDASGDGAAGPPKQELPSPHLWCTPGDWIVLLDPKAVGHERITCVASRFGKAGLLNATETAINNLTCLFVPGQRVTRHDHQSSPERGAGYQGTVPPTCETARHR